jgi:WD40 repeat protein/tetratricopeptide (TPR) repeat protein
LALACVALLVALAGGSLIAALSINEARNRALASAQHAKTAWRGAVATQQKLQEALAREERASRAAEELLVDAYTANGLVADERELPSEAALWFANAAAAAGASPAQQQHNRVRLAAWSHLMPEPVAVFRSLDDGVERVEFHPSQPLILVDHGTRGFSLWNYASAHSITLPNISDAPLTRACWTPDGSVLAFAARDGSLGLVSLPDGKLQHQWKIQAGVTALSFDPSGELLAIGSYKLNEGQIRLWSRTNRDWLTPPVVTPAGSAQAVFDGTGKYLALAGYDEKLRVFAVEANDRKLRPTECVVPHLASFTRAFSRPVFAAGSPRVLSISGSATATSWDVETGQQKSTMSERDRIEGIFSVPGTGQVAVAADFGVRIWDLRNQPSPIPLPLTIRHRNTVFQAASDGSRLLTAGRDRRAQFWQLYGTIATPLGPAIPHSYEVRAVALAPDGIHFATAQSDGLVRVWRGADFDSFHHHALTPLDAFVELSRDGRYMLAAGSNNFRSAKSTRVFEVETGEPAGPTLATPGFLLGALMGPDNAWVVTLSSAPSRASTANSEQMRLDPYEPGAVQFWDWRKGKRLGSPLTTASAPAGGALSPDGRRLVVLCASGEMLVVNTASREVERRLLHPGSFQHGLAARQSVAFAPDGSRLVASGTSGRATVWSTADWRQLRTLEVPSILCTAFSPDGKRVALATTEKAVHVFEVDTGQPAAPPLAHTDWVFHATFSADGKQLLTASRDHQARLWDWQAGRLLLPPLQHGDEVFDAAFHPTRPWLVTAARDGQIGLWETATGKRLAPWWKSGGVAHRILVTPDGQRLVVPLSKVGLGVLDLEILLAAEQGTAPPADVRTVGELLSSAHLVQSGVTPLETEAYLRRWQSLSQSKDFEPLSPADLVKRHRRWVRLLTYEGRGAAALPHLDAILQHQPDDAGALVQRGRAYRLQKNDALAVADYNRVIALQEERGESDSSLLAERAICHERMGQTALALADRHKIWLTLPDPTPSQRRSQALSYHALLEGLRAKEDRQSALEVVAMIESVLKPLLGPGVQAQDLYNMACVHGLRAGLLSEDSDEQQEQRQVEVKHALAYLRQAVIAGFRTKAKITSDGDLDPLRDEAEYKEILQLLDSPPDSTPPAVGERPVDS